MRSIVIGALGISVALIALPASAQVSESLVTRTVEALRLASKPDNPNTGLYSDWQVKANNIPRWSRLCLGRAITPSEFQNDAATARSIVTCVVRDVLNDEYRNSGKSDAIAVQRVAAWWMTGDPNQYNSGATRYAQRVLGFYQSSSTTKPTSTATKPTSIAAKLTPTTAKPISTAAKPTHTPEKPTSSEAKPTDTAEKPANPTEKPTNTTEKPTNTTEKPAAGAISQLKRQQTFYDRYMVAGYEASRRKDPKTALLYFRRALDERPNDQFALQAIRNAESALNPKQDRSPKSTSKSTSGGDVSTAHNR